MMTKEELETVDKDMLIGMVLAFQDRLRNAQKQPVDKDSALKEISANASKTQADVWTPQKIAERAHKMKEICRKEIKKQMKWQPSCKTGTTKWSYTGIVPTYEVFREMINEQPFARPWKLSKISTRQFEEQFGSIQASVRRT